MAIKAVTGLEDNLFHQKLEREIIFGHCQDPYDALALIYFIYSIDHLIFEPSE